MTGYKMEALFRQGFQGELTVTKCDQRVTVTLR